MSERLAPVIDLFTRRRIDHLSPVQSSPDELTQAEREHNWARLEYHERCVEVYRRRLGLLAVEHGVGQLSIESIGMEPGGEV